MTESLRPEAGYGSSFVTRGDVAAWWDDFAAPNQDTFIDYIFKLSLVYFDEEKQAFVMEEKCYDSDFQMTLLKMFNKNLEKDGKDFLEHWV